jgi:hypothetical protein
MDKRKCVDFKAIREELQGRCFICEMLVGNPEYQHHVVYEDERAVAFPNRYPSLYGDVFVAPKDHREQVTRDFSSTADATTHEVPTYRDLNAAIATIGDLVKCGQHSKRRQRCPLERRAPRQSAHTKGLHSNAGTPQAVAALGARAATLEHRRSNRPFQRWLLIPQTWVRGEAIVDGRAQR